MQIVIDIDEEDYKIMKHNIAVNNPLCPLSQEEMVSKVANGIPFQSAHWILYCDHKNMIDYPQCDNCGVIIKLPLPIDNLNFCPNCGKKWRKKND